MISFKEFVEHSTDEVFFTYGRMNPPTIGHEKLLNALKEHSGKSPYFVFLSPKSDNDKNPLLYEDKVKIVRKFFPQHSRRIVEDKNVKNILQACSYLYEHGFKKISLVVGSDRNDEFKSLIEKYNGVPSSHGFYNFSRISVICGGNRNSSSPILTEKISSSQIRESVKTGDKATFFQGLPKHISNSDAKKIYDKLKDNLSNKSLREQYITGSLFSLDEQVKIKKTGEPGYIRYLGTNYVIVETSNSKKRYWLSEVTK